jgi:hypothetical protein
MARYYLFKGRRQILSREHGEIKDGKLLLPSNITMPIGEAGLYLLPRERKVLYCADFLDAYKYFTKQGYINCVPKKDAAERLLFSLTSPIEIEKRITRLWLPLPKPYKNANRLTMIPAGNYFILTDKV